MMPSLAQTTVKDFNMEDWKYSGNVISPLCMELIIAEMAFLKKI